MPACQRIIALYSSHSTEKIISLLLLLLILIVVIIASSLRSQVEAACDGTLSIINCTRNNNFSSRPRSARLSCLNVSFDFVVSSIHVTVCDCIVLISITSACFVISWLYRVD